MKIVAIIGLSLIVAALMKIAFGVQASIFLSLVNRTLPPEHWRFNLTEALLTIGSSATIVTAIYTQSNGVILGPLFSIFCLAWLAYMCLKAWKLSAP